MHITIIQAACSAPRNVPAIHSTSQFYLMINCLLPIYFGTKNPQLKQPAVGAAVGFQPAFQLAIDLSPAALTAAAVFLPLKKLG
jgi:hypothetical protein